MNFKLINKLFAALLLYSCTTNTNMTPVITTIVPSQILLNSAVTGGSLTTDGGSKITKQGICWDTITDPTIAKNKIIDLSGKSVFLDTITGLKANKTYFTRAFATNIEGTSYGRNETFTTLSTLSTTLTTSPVTSITETTAISGGNITTDGGSPITARGVCWSTVPGATVTLSTKTTDGSGLGSFNSSMTGLTGTTMYYVRSYATNTLGTTYGAELFFTTTAKSVVAVIPVLITNVVTSIGYSAATSGGSITTDGGAPITARGVCWSTSASPTVSLSTITSDGTGFGSFTSAITGLLPSTTYHVRAYATNSQGTGYGQEQVFSTVQTAVPTLSTSSVTLISTTTAVTGGNISLDGGGAISSRGVCWSTSTTPTISLNTKTSDGTGVGIFTSNLAGLTASTLYYVRAYATNSVGTSYGNQVTFTTSAPVTTPTVPALVTNAITAINTTTAASGGVTTSDGGSTITARGVCWSTTTGPTTSLSTKTSEGTGAGSFTSNLSGLAASTSYYVRAYAVNTTGTGYGQELSFKTTALATIPTLTTTAVSSINITTAVSGGNVTTDGGSAVTARGVCWSTTSGATIGLSTKTSDGTGTGSYTSNITGLTASTLYYVRGYSTNAVGTAYGNELTFTTIAGSTNSTGTLTVNMTVTPSSGGWSNNGVAIWITNSAGVYIKSILAYATVGTGQRYLQSLTLYNKARNATGSGGAPAPVSGIDGITGASMTSNTGGAISATWNGTNVSGAVVPDGKYIICVEDYNGNYYSDVTNFSFTKNSTSGTTSPATVSIFSGVKLQWTTP